MTERAHSSLRQVAIARPEIGPYEVGYARERRPGVSWQHLAQQLGVNAVDLQRACDRRALPPVPVVAATPAKRGSRPVLGRLVVGSLEHRVLAAIKRGVAPEPRYVAEALAYDANGIGSTFSRLRTKGLLSQPRHHAPAEMTPLGVEELALLEAGEDE